MNPQPQNALEWVTAVGAVATPVLLAVFSAVGWAFKRRVERTQQNESEARERARKLEEELREDRIVVYNQILEPFVIVFTKDEGFMSDKAYKGKNKGQVIQEKILSVSYRQAVFKMSLFAPDEVVRAYNDLMQFFFANADNPAEATEGTTAEMMHLFGGFLLAIRRSVGNETTGLDSLEMLEWLISDVRKLRSSLRG